MTEEKHPLDDKRVADDAFTVKASSINVEKRTLRATVTNDLVDRDREIVGADAFKGRISTYWPRNPILLWNHDHFSPPIGKAVDFQINGKAIEAEFFFRQDDPLAQNIFGAYQQGLLTSFSVGFKTFARKDERDQEGKAISRITDAELIEISAVLAPSNTDAVVKQAAILEVLKRAQFAGGVVEEKTLFAPPPSKLDVLKRTLAYVKQDIEEGREKKSVPAAERAVQEQIAIALKALLAPSISDEEAKFQEELNAILSEFRKKAS